MINNNSINSNHKRNNNLERNQIKIHLSSVQEMQQNSTYRDLSKKHDKKEKKTDSEKNVKISIFRLYGHLNRPIDYLYMILALIGSIGSGISMPIQAYISSDLFSDVGNTSENIYSNIDQNNIYENIEKAFNRQINKLLTFGAVSFICTFLSVTFWNLVGQRDIHNFKYKYFSLLLKQEQGYFDKNNAFEFATKIQTQLDQVEEGLGGELGNILTSLIQCISGFIFAFITSWKLTLVMLSICPIVVLIFLFISFSMKKRMIKSREAFENAGGIAEELLYNIKTVSSFVNFDFEKKRYNEKIDLCFQLTLKIIFRLSLGVGLLLFFLNCTLFISLLYGRTLIGKEYNSNKGRNFTGGDVINVSFCTLMGIMCCGSFVQNIKTIQESCAASIDYFKLCEREIPIDISLSTEKPDKSSIKGEVVFKNVTFRYPSDEKKRNILNNLNIKFESGKKIALVGDSGCGKSTIVNLIERLYEPNSGGIYIDNIDIKKYDIEYLRSLIGYVQQEPVLFNKSIRENIIFGRENLLKDIGNIDDLINEACEESYAFEFINKLQNNLNYMVGIKGSKLSGGQKQRIAIARAILAKPKILILDEATSALDNKSEKEVQKALDNISEKNITVIIIAHRLSTIKNSDLIYAIKEGNVIEQGTHKELLEKKGYYANLIKSQLAQYEIEEKDIKNSKLSEQTNNTSEEVQFEKKDDIYIEQDNIKIEPKRLFMEISDKKLNIFLACLGAAILGGMSPVNGIMMGNAMNGLNSKFDNIIYDKGLKYALLFLLVAFLQGLGNTLMNMEFMIIGANLAKIYRKKLLEKYLRLHISFFDLNCNSPGSLLTRLSMDTAQLNSFMLSIFGISIQCSITFIVGLIFGCIYEYRLTLIIFCFVPFIVLSMIIRRMFNNANSIKGRSSKIEAGGILSECVTNTKTIYSFNFQKKALDMYMEILDFIKKKFVRDSIISGFFIGLGQFCFFAANSTVFYAAKKYILKGEINSEDMAMALNVVVASASGISQGMGNIGDLKKAKNAFKSLYSVLDIKNQISSFKEDNENKINPENITGKIEFRNVYFAYPTRPEQIILNNVSFIIEPGQQVGIVGYSGSGKSTIIQLLERFYDIEDGKGEILIDDINIKEYNLYELRKKIGLVSQEPILFKRSVLENVRYGNLNATNEDCIQAAKNANIMKFFTDDKMNEVIEAGNNKHSDTKNKNEIGKKEDPVSGGEKQRLAIARVFLKNPAIVLLDEATSALDKDSELEVQKSLDKLCSNRTSVTIAHRLNTIEKCDKILVINNGKVVEQGTHQELMELKNKYYTLYKYSVS